MLRIFCHFPLYFLSIHSCYDEESSSPSIHVRLTEKSLVSYRYSYASVSPILIYIFFLVYAFLVVR